MNIAVLTLIEKVLEKFSITMIPNPMKNVEIIFVKVINY